MPVVVKKINGRGRSRKLVGFIYCLIRNTRNCRIILLLGPHIIEGLVRWPPVHVRGWFLTDATSKEQIRDVLLDVRRLGISNVIAATSQIVTERILAAVCMNIESYDPFTRRTLRQRIVFRTCFLFQRRDMYTSRD